MEKSPRENRSSREDWLRMALTILRESGVDGIKITVIARRMGLTSGSFYWHFKNVQDLLDAVLDYWENHLTHHITEDALAFDGAPQDRILNLMCQVIEEDAALPDSAISVWAKSDANAQVVFDRTIRARFDFAGWMFQQAGFDPSEATIRGRLMVTSLLGETARDLKADKGWKRIIEGQWRVLLGHKDG